MKSIVTLTLVLTIVSLSAQMTPEKVIQKQLEAYNNRDIETFMSLVDEDITFHDFSDGRITMEGLKACKKFYSDLFKASPKLHSTVLTRTVFENKIIDHERITGRNGNINAIELVLIYEVDNEKITKVTVVKNEK